MDRNGLNLKGRCAARGLTLGAAAFTFVVSAAVVNAHAAVVVDSSGTVGSEAASAGSVLQPGQTHTADEMAHLSDNTLEWYEIDDLVDEYNTTVLKNRNDYNHDERKTKDAKEVSDYLLNQAEDLEDQASALEDTSALVAAQYRSSANSLRLQAENNVTDYRVIQLENELSEKNIASGARNMFLDYYKALALKEYAESNVAYLQKAYDSAVNKQSVGMATEIEVLTARESLDSARASLINAGSDITSNRYGLLVLCGWKYDADAVIGAMPEMTTDFIASIDYEADKAKALEASYTLRIDKLSIENSNAASNTGLVLQQYTEQQQTDTDNFNVSFKAAYDALVNAGIAYDNAVTARAKGETDLAAMERQHGLGLASDIDYEASKLSLEALKQAETDAYIELVSAKMTYDYAVEGVL